MIEEIMTNLFDRCASVATHTNTVTSRKFQYLIVTRYKQSQLSQSRSIHILSQKLTILSAQKQLEELKWFDADTNTNTICTN